MKVKGVIHLLKDSRGYFHIKFDGSIASLKIGDRSENRYWSYRPFLNHRSKDFRWIRDWNNYRSRYFNWVSSTPFEFMVLTGTSLLSAIKYGKIYGGKPRKIERDLFLKIRKEIRQLNPVPQKRVSPNA